MRIVSLILAATAFLSSAAANPLADADGAHYAGWLYFNEIGADMPLRLRVAPAANHGADQGPAALLDVPAYGEAGLRMTIGDGPGGGVTLEGPGVAGFDLRIELAPIEDGFRGESTWTNADRTLTADVWLHRSAAALPWVPPGDIPNPTGVYALGDGRSLILTQRPWGEIFYTDTLTGRAGFLFAQTPTTFFAGDGVYVPGAVRARASLHVGEGGEATHLVWQDAGGKPALAARRAFITEPVTFNSGDVTLSGRITRLPGDSPRPGLVVIGGSDWSTAAGLERFAQTFASFGLSVLTFDKRGFGESTGEKDIPFEETGADLAAAAGALAARDDVIDAQVGLFGYSRAGWQIPSAAAMSDHVNFVILFVPPAVTVAEQETASRLARFRRKHDPTPADLTLTHDYLDAMWSFAITGENADDYLRLRQRIVERGWADALGGVDSVAPEDWRWDRLNADYDPTEALRRVTCPVLALFGGADETVTVEQNLDPFRTALAAAGAADVTTLVIPGADHGLRLAPIGEARFHNGGHYAPVVWRTVYDWLARRVDLPAGK